MKRPILQLAAICSLTFTLNSFAAVLCVDLNSASPTPPYTNWVTAATNIQDAVDAASPGDQIRVTNGVYQTGGKVVYGAMTNRVAVTKAVTVQSVNGPEVTVIQGYRVPSTTNGTAAVRCVYLTNDAVLIGFTLTNGATRTSGDSYKEQCGGGVWCESVSVTISNCVLLGNSAYSYGGGAYYGTLNNCVLTGNKALNWGGGAYGGISTFPIHCKLSNCTLAGNSAGGGPGECSGGGVMSCWLTNCTLITNSAYTSGGGAESSMLTNCTLLGNYTTASDGYGGGADASTLNNCILINNHATWGGGVSYSYVSNNRLTGCTLIGNHATNNGGATYGCDLNNCTLMGNSASLNGGGTYYGILNNCTLVGNSASSSGGGAYNGSLTNCIVYYNTAPAYSNYGGTFLSMGYCCTFPIPSGQNAGNFTNAPVFVSLAGGDLHQKTNSPTINGGNNAFVISNTDLDGNPRIVGGTVDVGAYEYQGSNFGLPIPIPWLRQYSLPTDGSADYIDSDNDGMNNWQEWIAGTSPINALSVLKVLAPSNTVSGMTVTWQSVSGVTYYLQRGGNLIAQPAFSIIQSNIVGQAGKTSYLDTTAVGDGPFFYRVGVQ